VLSVAYEPVINEIKRREMAAALIQLLVSIAVSNLYKLLHYYHGTPTSPDKLTA
jgi:hypothetical protein